MSMRYHVDRHTVDFQTEIRSVINIEPSKKNLLCLPAPRMLGDKQPRYHPQDILRCVDGSQFDIHLCKGINWPVSSCTNQNIRKKYFTRCQTENSFESLQPIYLDFLFQRSISNVCN